jgi:hypothetical protein
MATVRQQIIDAVSARLKLIKVGKTFSLGGVATACASNIGDSVEVWRTRPLGDREGWALILRDMAAPIDRSAEGATVGSHLHRLTVRADLLVKDRAAPEMVRDILADVLLAVGSDPRWGGLARWTDVETTDIEVDDTGARMAGASVAMTITYKTALFKM